MNSTLQVVGSGLCRYACIFSLTLLVVFSGCRDNPGKWTTERVAEKVSESLELSSLELTTTADGMEGSGKRSDGETVSVVVELQPQDSKFTWEATGDRGFVESGYFQLK